MIKEEDKRGETSLYVMFQIFITDRIQMNSRLIIRFEAIIPWIHASHYMTNEQLVSEDETIHLIKH